MEEDVTEETPDGKAQQLLQLLASNLTKKDKCQYLFFLDLQPPVSFPYALINTS